MSKPKKETNKSDWKKFEQDCVEYLKSNCGEHATFEHLGESDSTVSDIKVTTNSGKNFYMEAKHLPAQCGQFVLFADEITQTFSFSEGNKSTQNEITTKIIDFMNNNFSRFANAGTAGEKIDLKDCEELFANWIIDKYKKMGVKYIITNNFTIFALEDLLKYFKIRAKYRIKKSGSGKPAKKYYNDISNILKSSYNIQEYNICNKAMFVCSNRDINKQKFRLGEYDYQFAKKDDNYYEIRKLSNTFNLNVIFDIVLRQNIGGISIKDFILFLISY